MTEMERLLRIMAQLRAPNGGCEWDRAQNFQSIARYTLEEAYEVVEAIDNNDMASLRDELGDLLLQVVFHAQMADELGHFAFNDVAEAVSEKMVRRHPHVFGDEVFADEDAQKQSWEQIKAAERGEKLADTSILADIPSALPALMRSEKIQKRVASVGFDWPSLAPVFDKIDEELLELKAEIDHPSPTKTAIEEEYGDLLFVVVNLARHLKISPEMALKKANAKFENRFKKLEQEIDKSEKNLTDLSLDEMESIWQNIKLRD